MIAMILIIGILMGVVLTATIAFLYQRVVAEREAQHRIWREEKRYRDSMRQALEKKEPLERLISEEAQKGLQRRDEA